jgi:peptidoglycan-N-acetylglucosamine deacetylase
VIPWTEWLDRWFARRYKIRPIGEGGFIFRLGLVKHGGPRLEFRDGTVVRPGDLVGELHMDNARAAALHAQGRAGFRFRREVFRVLPALAQDLERRPEYRSLPAVCGASLLWAEAEVAGFEHRPLPAFMRWWLTWWERHLLAKYHPQGRRRLTMGNRTDLRQIWMTRRTLLTRYGRAPAGRLPAAEEVARDSSAAPPA